MRALGIFIFIFIASATYGRLFFGVDLTDESQYVAQAYAPAIGASPFQSDLLIQQTADLLISPLVKFYSQFFKTEGIVLFVRHLFFLLVLCASIISVLFFQKITSPFMAWVISSFCIGFVPFSIPSWSYNTVTIVALPTSLFLYYGWPRWGPVLGGVVGSLVMFCYPTMIAVYLAVLVAELISGDAAKRTSSKLFFVSLFVGGSLALAYMLFFVGTEKLRMLFNFSQLFGELGGVRKLKEIFVEYWSGFRKTGVIVLPILFLYHRFIRPDPRIRKFSFLLLAVGLCFEFWLKSIPNAQVSIRWLIFSSSFAFGLLVFESHISQIKISKLELNLIFLGFLSAFIFAYSSGNGFIAFGLGCVLPLQVSLVKLFCIWEGFAIKRRLAELVTVSCALFLAVSNFTYIYRDANFLSLNEQIKNGPFKYLYTRKETADFVRRSQEEIVNRSSGKKSIFVSYLTCAYLFTDLLPITGMLFLHEIQWQSEQMEMILYQTKKMGKWPELVVTKISSVIGFKHQFEDFFLESGKYKVTYSATDLRILELIR